jgi:hypothetical protein
MTQMGLNLDGSQRTGANDFVLAPTMQRNNKIQPKQMVSVGKSKAESEGVDYLKLAKLQFLSNFGILNGHLSYQNQPPLSQHHRRQIPRT